VSNTQTGNEARTAVGTAKAVDMKLEVVVIPVADVDRAKQFYTELGWKLDVDIAKDEQFRVVHFTPPGSQSSILFGKGVTTQEPGSAQGLHLIRWPVPPRGRGRARERPASDTAQLWFVRLVQRS
jgi:catechol 2,3-dioxygenase-like lactoylglutathione lyase family enzyme